MFSLHQIRHGSPGAFRWSVLPAAFCLVFAAAAQAASEAPITAVTLYPGGASIERTAAVAPGMVAVTVTNLPASFDTQTLYVQATTGVSVGQVVIKDVSTTTATDARVAQLADKIQALQDQEGEVEAQIHSAELVKGYLEGVNGDGNGKQAPTLDGKNMAGVLDILQKTASNTFVSLHRLAVQKRELDKKIAALQEEQKRIGDDAKDSRTVTVNLAAAQPGEITLSYQIANAGWKPVYRATLASANSTVMLQRLATVSQQTGEDWNNVRLRLSTVQPRALLQAPEPVSWLLSYRQPQAMQDRTAMAPAAAPEPAMLAAGAVAAKAESHNDYAAPVLEQQTPFATEFEVPGRVSLPADGREVAVALASQSLPVQLQARTAPRQEAAAVIMAVAERPEGVWLDGDMQLYRDGSYVGMSYWRPEESEKLTLSFGRDDLLRVAVSDIPDHSGTAGIFGGHHQRQVGHAYTITSQHKTPVEVLVLESSPVSTSDEISVKTAYSQEPTITDWEDHKGVVGWSQTLKPGASVRLSVQYTINYPKEGYVVGLR